MTSEYLSQIAFDWLDHESQHAVEEIERTADWGDDFPRPLEQDIPIALPVMIVNIPNLHAATANRWLMSRGREECFDSDNRPLHGNFLGHEGNGFIFVDANDSLQERRFTIGHEVGHFLLDYLFPRRRAIEHFGPDICAVMDNKRRATITERFRSVLTAIPIGPHTNLMERKSGGEDVMELYACESRADHIALALIAPPQSVLRDWQAIEQGEHNHATMVQLLTGKYELPLGVARGYANALLDEIAPASPYDKVARLK